MTWISFMFLFLRHNKFLQTLSFLSSSPRLSASPSDCMPLFCLDWYLSKWEVALMNCQAFNSVAYSVKRRCRSWNAGRCIQVAKAERASSTSVLFSAYPCNCSFPNTFCWEGNAQRRVVKWSFVSNICLGLEGGGVFGLKFRFGSFSACYMHGFCFVPFALWSSRLQPINSGKKLNVGYSSRRGLF